MPAPATARCGQARALQCVASQWIGLASGADRAVALQLDCDLAELAGELERRCVGVGDRRAFVGTNVGAFVGREHAALRALDATAGNGLSIDQERAFAALAKAAAVILELEADRRLPGGQCLVGGDGVLLEAEEVV